MKGLTARISYLQKTEKEPSERVSSLPLSNNFPNRQILKETLDYKLSKHDSEQHLHHLFSRAKAKETWDKHAYTHVKANAVRGESQDKWRR